MAKFIKTVDLWNTETIKAIEQGLLSLQCGQWVKFGDGSKKSRFVAKTEDGKLIFAHGGNAREVNKNFSYKVKQLKKVSKMLKANKPKFLNDRFKQTEKEYNTKKQAKTNNTATLLACIVTTFILVASAVSNSPEMAFIGLLASLAVTVPKLSIKLESLSSDVLEVCK